MQENGEDQDAALGVMARIMPWVISGFFHLGILVILGFLTIVLMPPVVADSVSMAVPTVDLGKGSGGPITPGREDRQQDMQPLKAADTEAFAERSNDRIIVDGPDKPGEKVKVIGLRKKPGDGKEVSGLFRPSDDKAKFRPPGDPGPPIPRAYHIVYLIDHSGSMLDSLEVVKKEMVRSIGHLRPDLGQSFHAVFFSDGKPLENPPRRLVLATEDRKLEALKFLRSVRAASATGRTDPMDGLKRAFRVLRAAPNDKKGKVIYLLTDGEFYDNEKVLRTARKLNAAGEVRIYTALYGYRSPTATKVLKQMAEESGGTFRFIERY